jgi:hypothetical protein
MRPLRGVVTRASSRALDVRLESGKLVTGPNSYKLAKYDRVMVMYDYTENQVVGIEPYDADAEAKEMASVEPDVEVLEDGEVSDDTLESLEDPDSGALCLSGDEFWDPEEGLLRMEGESSIE